MDGQTTLKNKLSTIVELTDLLRKENNILDIYREITEIATKITGSERSSLFIYDKEADLLSSKIALGMDEKISITLDVGIAGHCGKNRTRVIENNTYANPLFNTKIDMQSGYTTKQLLSVPIIGKFDNLLGVLQVLNNQVGDYTENDADLLAIVAELAASVIEDHHIKQILKEQVDTKTKELRIINQNLGEQVATEIALNQKLQEEKQLQEELLIERAKLAELGKMIGFISHQMKQPLNAVNVISQGLSEAFYRKELDEAYMADSTQMLSDSVRFLSRTIDDFRLFVKHDRQREPFVLQHSVTEVLRMLEPLSRMNEISVLNDIQDGLETRGIVNEFKQVLINLLTNAIDQVKLKKPDAPVLKLIGRRDRGDIVIQIRDNAGGIDPNLLPEKLFESNVTTKGNQGTGLGLHISRLIIENHMDGTITACNTEGGAEFTIRMPESR